jgi:hypothetical protein
MEAIMTITTPWHTDHQLDQLAGQFEHWRQTRTHLSEQIPQALWDQAVALTATLPPTRVGFPEESEQKSTLSCPVCWTVTCKPAILKDMETREVLRQRVRREQQLKTRLRLATTRLADAEQERIWAIVAAHQAGLSIRQIATATGLSRSRIHQLLQDNEACVAQCPS